MTLVTQTLIISHLHTNNQQPNQQQFLFHPMRNDPHIFKATFGHILAVTFNITAIKCDVLGFCHTRLERLVSNLLASTYHWRKNVHCPHRLASACWLALNWIGQKDIAAAKMSLWLVWSPVLYMENAELTSHTPHLLFKSKWSCWVFTRNPALSIGDVGNFHLASSL